MMRATILSSVKRKVRDELMHIWLMYNRQRALLTVKDIIFMPHLTTKTGEITL